MRHGAHKANVLTPEAVDMCLVTGKALAETGIEIHQVWSSPAARAIETALETLHGYNKMVYFHTDDRLADTAINEAGRNAVAKVKAIMKEHEVSGEAAMADILFDPNGEFADFMTDRGEEGADCLCDIVSKNPGKTILATSHGIAKIENTLMILNKKLLHQPEKLVTTCQIIELILDSHSGEVIEENWLEPIAA